MGKKYLSKTTEKTMKHACKTSIKKIKKNLQSRSSLAEKQADESQTRGDHPDFNQRAQTTDQSAAPSLHPNGSYGTNVGHLGQTLCPLLALVNVSPSKPRR